MSKTRSRTFFETAVFEVKDATVDLFRPYRPGGPRTPVRFLRSGGFGYSEIEGALFVFKGVVVYFSTF